MLINNYLVLIALIFLVACTDANEGKESPDLPADHMEKSKTVKENAISKNSDTNTEAVSGTGEIEVIGTNLNAPWEIVQFDQSIYVSERNGSIIEVLDGNVEKKQVVLEKELSNQPEAGLLGLAFPDTFSEDRQAFAYYSYTSERGVFQRLAMIEEQEDQWLETDVLVDEIPGGQYHQGGRIEIGPDRKLYVTTGDATNPDLAQNENSLAGKILRLNFDGSIPEDNPYENSYVFSYGHRNPQGLAWNNNTGDLYATEHGNQAHDEVNFIQPGENYGWPMIEGDQEADNMLTPVIHSGNDTWAPSGMTYYNGDFYFASLRGEAIRKVNLDTRSSEIIIEDYGRIRDVLATEKGIYFITNNTDGRGNPSEEDDRLLLWNGS